MQGTLFAVKCVLNGQESGTLLVEGGTLYFAYVKYGVLQYTSLTQDSAQDRRAV